MPIVHQATGSVETADIQQIRITRTPGGALLGEVTYAVASPASSRTATWTLSASEKSAIAGLLPGAVAAVKTAEGL